MQEALKSAGYQIVGFVDGADLVIVNTCTVTGATDAQSRNLIRRARRQNAVCRVIVTGCYAQVDPQALRDLPGLSGLKTLDAADGTSRFELRAPFQQDLVGAVANAAVQHGWQLGELHESRFTLEDTFIALTRAASQTREVA